MTVGELIDKLSKHDRDTEIIISDLMDGDYGFCLKPSDMSTEELGMPLFATDDFRWAEECRLEENSKDQSMIM